VNKRDLLFALKGVMALREIVVHQSGVKDKRIILDSSTDGYCCEHGDFTIDARDAVRYGGHVWPIQCTSCGLIFALKCNPCRRVNGMQVLEREIVA
jgi:hypothetical protein